MDSIPRLNKLECDAILFDLDGVLIDSTECILRHWKTWAETHAVDFEQILAVAHGRRSIETIRLVAPHLNAELEDRLFTEYEASDNDGIITIPGAKELLNSLPSANWAIATSASRELAISRLIHAGLPLPKVIVTANDVVNGKPHPEPYLTAAEKLGYAADNCVVVEDSPAGISAALAAGMRVLAVASTHQPGELTEATMLAPALSVITWSRGIRKAISIQLRSN